MSPLPVPAGTRNLAPVRPSASALLELTDAQREMLFKRALFLKPIRQLIDVGCSQSTAVNRVLGQIKRRELPSDYITLAYTVGRKGRNVPSASTIKAWLKAVDSENAVALAPKHTGRQHVAEGWEAAAERAYARMQKPSIASVVDDLKPHFPSISYDKVRRYLQALPETRGTNGPARVGRHFFKQSRSDYRERDLSNLRPGEIWQGDGHRVDTYLAHPMTGRVWRPELTAWIDVVSRYIVGWYLAENESTATTNFALCHALQTSGHQPLMVHVDNGSGFASRLMADPIFTEDSSANEAELARTLIDTYGAEQVAAAFVRRHRAGRTAPEDLRDVDDRAPSRDRNERGDRRDRDDRPPRDWPGRPDFPNTSLLA